MDPVRASGGMVDVGVECPLDVLGVLYMVVFLVHGGLPCAFSPRDSFVGLREPSGSFRVWRPTAGTAALLGGGPNIPLVAPLATSPGGIIGLSGGFYTVPIGRGMCSLNVWFRGIGSDFLVAPTGYRGVSNGWSVGPTGCVVGHRVGGVDGTTMPVWVTTREVATGASFLVLIFQLGVSTNFYTT